MFADEYWNIQTETMELEFPHFSLNFDFENLENETPNKRVEQKAEECWRTKRYQHNLHYVPGKHGFNRALNITEFLAEFGYGRYLIVPFLVRFGCISDSFGLVIGILARLRLAKIRTMARPNSPDMRPKRTKKVRLGIISDFI